MNTEIVRYLASAEPDFNAGFALFCKYSRNRIAMDWISRRHDRAKLMYELEKLSRITAARDVPSEFVPPAVAVSPVVPLHQPEAPASTAEPKRPAKKETVFKTYDDRRTRRSDLPPEYQAVFDRIAEDYKLRRALHEKMKLAKTDLDRSQLRSLVLETDERIRSGWAQIDEYQARKASEAESVRVFNESTCRSYISKFLKRGSVSAAQVSTCRERLHALLEHGCAVDVKTLERLKEYGID